VNDVVPVSVSQRGGNGAGDPECRIEGKLALAGEAVAQGLAPGVGHHEVEQPVTLAGVMHRQDLGMGQPSGDADLAQEALGLVGMAAAGQQDLDGHLTAVFQVLR
jgi:hypothetical protein